jgi:hypothetical protein
MPAQIELPSDAAALVVHADGRIDFHIPGLDALANADDIVPLPMMALLGCGLQLRDNELFVESILEWLDDKLDEDEL